jgi:urease accessory protein UreE
LSLRQQQEVQKIWDIFLLTKTYQSGLEKMNKKMTALAVATLSSLALLGCNSDSNDDSELSNNNTGDTLILTNDGMISSIDRMTPNKIVSNLKITGLQSGDELVGIDYRPKDSKLYAVGLLGNIYTLNPTTGAATFVRKLMADPTDTTDGNAPFSQIIGNPNLISVNFNPVADRLRVISDTGQNLRINVDTGATITDGSIKLTEANPAVVAAAYTNAFAGTGSTKLYSIDQNSDRIYLQNANAGTLGISAALGADINTNGGGGFDIDPVNNVGFAALKLTSGAYKFYQLNLANIGSSNDTVYASSDLANSFNTMGIRGIALKRASDATAQGFGLTANNKLLNFALNNPNTVTEKTLTGLLVDERFIGIDYRLRTSTEHSAKLYGITNKANLYTINTDTGLASLVTALKPATGSSFTALEGTSFAVDFNPSADRLRVISNTGQNLRINVDTGDTLKDGDINGATGAKVTAAAYTNSFKTSVATLATELFDLDQGNKTLTKQSPPNNGTLNLIGDLGINLGTDSGFDIAGGDNGYALATISGESGASVLYRIDLNSDTTITTPRARLAINADGVPNLAASTIGNNTTPQVIDLAILFK